jgi:hypothetical protein
MGQARAAMQTPSEGEMDLPLHSGQEGAPVPFALDEEDRRSPDTESSMQGFFSDSVYKASFGAGDS